MAKRKISVLLTTEGTYPYFEGGVSTWCEFLIRELPEIDFTLMSLAARPGLPSAYQLPSNVVEWLPVPLWGTGGANELRREVGWRSLRAMGERFKERTVRSAFAEAFDLLLTGLLDERGTVDQVGAGLRQLAAFFTTHNYDAIFRHPTTWSLFQRQVTRSLPALMAEAGETTPPSLLDLAEALRLLYRWLTPLAVPIPRVDVVHASAAGLASLPGIVAKLERGTPFVLTEHGVYLRERYLAWAKAGFTPFVKLFATRVIKRLVELTYACADKIVPVTRWNMRWEIKLGAPAEKITVIPNGVDPQRFAPQPLPDAATPTLVWVGRIDPLKDLLTLIEATAKIRDAIPNVKVLLFGKASPGNADYEVACRAKQHELGLDNTLEFKGFAKSPQDAYAQGHAVVLSSISEALPFSVIEAMLCGRAMIGTEVGGVPEAIGEGGRVVQPRDPEALATASIEVLRSPELYTELGIRARQHALEHYTLQHLVAAYRTLYRDLAPVSSAVTVEEEIPSGMPGLPAHGGLIASFSRI